MNLSGDELGAIKQVFSKLTIYMREWEGTVIKNDDPLNLGRIKVSIPQLGWQNDNEIPWIMPRYRNNQITPQIDTMVVVGFFDGTIQTPYYDSRTPLFRDNRLSAYENPNTVVLFQDDKQDPLTVIYHRDTKIIDVLLIDNKGYSLKIDAKNKKINLGLGEKSTILMEDGKLTVTLDKCKMITDGSKWTFDANGNQIIMDNGKTTVSGNLEVTK